MKFRNILSAAVSSMVLLSSAVFAQSTAEKVLPSSRSFGIDMNDCMFWVEGEYYEFDNEIYLPLRKFTEKLGMDISWEEESKTVSITENDKVKLFPFRDRELNLEGYKDIEENIVIHPQYESAYEFSECLACVGVRKDNVIQYGYIDETGELVIPAVYKRAYAFSDGIALAVIGDANVTDVEDTEIFINKAGEKCIDKEFFDAGLFCDGFAPVLKDGPSYPVPQELGLKQVWSYIGKDGEYATDLEFDKAYDFCDGVAEVYKDGKWGAINTDFEFVIDCKYDEYSDLINELLLSEKYITDFNIKFNGNEQKLNSDIVVINNSTYISLNDIETIFGLDTEWTKKFTMLTIKQTQPND